MSATPVIMVDSTNETLIVNACLNYSGICPVFIGYNVETFISLPSECAFATSLKNKLRHIIDPERYHVMFDNRHYGKDIVYILIIPKARVPKARDTQCLWHSLCWMHNLT